MSDLNLTEEARIQRQKFNYFYSKVGNNDPDQAIQYLILADWDERKAVQIYMSRHQSQNIHHNSNPSNNYNGNRNVLNQNNNNNNISNNNQRPVQHQQHPPASQINFQNILEYKINNSFLKGNVTCQYKDKIPFSNFIIYLNGKFPFIVKSLEQFLNLLNDHAGFIILMNLNHIEHVKNHFRKVRNDSLCFDIVKNAVIFPIMNDSILGSDLVNQLSCISFPSYIFCKYKNQNNIQINGRMEGAFHNTLLIDKLLNSFPDSQSELSSSLRRDLRQSIMNNININDNNVRNNNNFNNNKNNNNDFFGEHNQDFFLGDTQEMNKLIEKLSKNDLNDLNNNQNNNNNLNNNNRNMNNNVNNIGYSRHNVNSNNPNPNNNEINDNNININDSIAGLSYGEILAKRENEMKELERQQEEKLKKEEEEKRKKLEEENKLKKIEENCKKEAEVSKNLLPPEPEEGNPDACTIVLRYPDGIKIMERRFLKTDKVSILFHFVKSKGREIFSEQQYNDFELIFGFPPKNLENSKDKTLDEEGMFPNAIINIKEKS